MDQKNLITLIKILRRNGVVHYKDKDVELTLEPTKQNTKEMSLSGGGGGPISDISPIENFKSELGTMTEEDFLYYSSGYDPRSTNQTLEPTGQTIGEKAKAI